MAPRGFFYVLDHQKKSRRYVWALEQLGWRQTGILNKAKFLLTDTDVHGRLRILDTARKRGIRIFIYPHAARPNIAWDGIYEPYPYVDAQLVIGEGQAEVLRRYGYPHPLEVTGWSYCFIRPFHATRGKKILFAPNHPNANGWLSNVDRDSNRRAFEILLGLLRAGKIDQLSVQYLRGLENNGLPEEPDVRYIKSRPDQSTANIDEADVVVAVQTVAYMAIARGVPTIMFGEDIPPHAGNADDNFHFVRSWEKYRSVMQYPFDLTNTSDPAGLIAHASQCEEPVQAWREMFIGRQLTPERLGRALDRYLVEDPVYA